MTARHSPGGGLGGTTSDASMGRLGLRAVAGEGGCAGDGMVAQSLATISTPLNVPGIA